MSSGLSAWRTSHAHASLPSLIAMVPVRHGMQAQAARLQWQLSIIDGLMPNAGTAVLSVKKQLAEVLRLALSSSSQVGARVNYIAAADAQLGMLCSLHAVLYASGALIRVSFMLEMKLTGLLLASKLLVMHVPANLLRSCTCLLEDCL